MQEASLYNQVISKNGDEKTQADLVNSYRFRSNSPVKYKKWSPEISREEMYKKKRDREDEYVKTLDDEEKPILLIKKKELFKNVKNPQIIEDPSEQNDFYKVSKNTEVIEDINEQIQLNEDLVRKNTVVHTPKYDSDEPAALKNIYQIEGIEFLPEGFLELDPLLMQDEYEFDSDVHKEIFSEEQKKVKAQRRKQYTQKDLQKKREVTIFVVDQYKDKLVEYLDQWYAANKRKMTPDELEYISKVLKTDPVSMGRLQDLYLHRKKVLNSQQLHGHLFPEGKMKNDRFDVLPDNLKKLFATKESDAYNEVQPRVYKNNEAYEPVYLNKYKNKNKKNKSKNANSTKGTLSPSGTQNLSDNQEKNFTKFSDNFEDVINGGTYNPYQTNDKNIATSTDRIKKNVKYSNNLNEYFDTEINTILNKIRGLIPSKNDESEVTINKESEKIIAQYKEKLADLIKRDTSNSEVIRIDSQLRLYNENPGEYKPYAKTDMLNNPIEYNFKPKRSSIDYGNQPKVSMMADNKMESISPRKGSFTKNKKSENEPLDENLDKSVILEENNDGKETTRVKDTTQIKRVTIVSQNDRGASIVTQKIPPSLVSNEYFYQVVDDVIESNGTRKTTIITRNEKGEIVAEQTIDPQEVGNFYRSYIVTEPEANRISIIVRNEKGQTISVTPVRTATVDRHETIEAVVQRNGTRRSTIITKEVEGEIRRVHKIRPILIGSEFYCQLVEEIIEGSSKKRLTVTTLNENGDVVSISRANPNMMAENYYTEIVNDIIDAEGQRKIMLATKNNRSEVLIQQTFTTSLAGILEEQSFTEMLEEVEDEGGNRKVTIASKNARGYTEVSQQYRPANLGEKFYIEIIKDIINSEGVRKVTIAAKDNKGEVIIEKQYSPSINELIGENYYEDVTRELENELNRLSKTKKSVKKPTKLHNFTLEMHEKTDPSGETQVMIIARNLNGGVLMEKSYLVNHSAILGDQYYDEIISDIEDEIAGKIQGRRSVISNVNGLSQIIEVDEQNTVSAVSRKQSMKPADKIHESIVDSLIHGHEQKVLEKNSLNKSVPRVTRVRDSYYRDLLNELGSKKKSYATNIRTTEPSNLQNDLYDSKKSSTLNPNSSSYLKPKTSLIKTKSPASILEDVRSKNSTIDNRSKSPALETSEYQKMSKTQTEKPKLSEVDPLPKNISAKTPTRSTVGGKIEERAKTPTKTSLVKKNSIPSKKDTQIKESVVSNNVITENKNSNLSEAPVKKSSVGSVVINQLNKKSILENILLSGADHNNHIHDSQNHNEQVALAHSEKTVPHMQSIKEPEHTSQKSSVKENNSKLDAIEAHHNLPKESSLQNGHETNLDENTRFSSALVPSPQSFREIEAQIEQNKIHKSESIKRLSKVGVPEKLKEDFEKVMNEYKEKVSDDVIEKIEEAMTRKQSDNILDEFYAFCETELPHDSKFKESVMLVSLFYYFLERKKMIKTE
jgi:hypothetical protein